MLLAFSIIKIGRVLPSKINQELVGVLAVVLGVDVMSHALVTKPFAGVVKFASVVICAVVMPTIPLLLPLPTASACPEVAVSHTLLLTVPALLPINPP